MNKKHLRVLLQKKRGEISEKRRGEAKLALLSGILSHLSQLDVDFTHALSFVSFKSEIDTTLLNFYLARTNRLLLPLIEGNTLKIFRVTNPKIELEANSFGLYQPNPKFCEEEKISSIQIVLVPALGFAQNNHRLGYGWGFYDRFLRTVPHAQTIGIGFKEQWVAQLPFSPTDVPLQKVSLF